MLSSVMLNWAAVVGGTVVILIGIKFLLPRKVHSVDQLDPNPVYNEWGGDRSAQGLGFLIGGLTMMCFGAHALGFFTWLKAQLY